MALKKKPKRLNINFNFSDESDNEQDTGSSNTQTKNVLKELKLESNHTEGLTKYLLSTDDKTIISSDHLHISELPSFSEDFGLPVTESTCLDVFDSDPTLYLTALGDDLNLSQTHHRTAAENKCHHISHRTITTQNPHTAAFKNSHAEDKENFNNNKGEIISRASALSHKPAINNQEKSSGWSNIRETPRKGNKTPVQHRLYDNDEYFTPFKVDCTSERNNCTPLIQNECTDVSADTSRGSASDDRSSLHDQSSLHNQSSLHSQSSLQDHSSLQDQSLTDSFVEVQDTSVQTSFFAINDIIPGSTENRVCDLHNSMPDCEDSIKSDVSLFDSPNQATDSTVCEKSVSDSSAGTDDDDDLLASSYEVQDISVQTSFVESLVPDDKSSATHLEHSSVAPECIDPSLDNIQKSLMELSIQHDQDEVCTTQSNDDKQRSRCCSRISINQERDMFITDFHKTEFESVSENSQTDSCTTAMDGKVNKHETIHPANVALSGRGFGTCRDQHSDCTANQRNSSQNRSDGQKNGYRCSSSNVSDGESSSDGLVVASECEEEDRETESKADNIDEDELLKGEADEHSDYYCVDKRKWTTTSRKHCLTVANYECEAKSGANGSSQDCRSADHTVAKTWAHAEDKHSPNQDGVAKALTLAAVPVDSRSRRQVSESSDDDSDFEHFLYRVKSSSKPEKPVGEEMPLNEFIIDEDEDDDDDSSKTTDDDSDDAVFYIRTNNELDDVKNKRHLAPRFQEKAYTYYHSEASSSDIDGSDSDLDDFIVDVNPKKKNAKVRSTSGDESSLDPKPAKTSKRHGKNNTCNDDREELDERNKVSTTHEKHTDLPTRPLTQQGSVEDDCLSRAQRTTPFKIPRYVEQWKRPFETSTRLDVNKDEFKTPRNVKGLDLHAMTAPRPAFPSDVVNDNAFFLKSLNVDMADYKRHADAARFIKRFKETKVELTQKIFRMFNHTVFENKLPTDFQIEWNSRYTKTAGTFHYKGNQTSFVTKIVLSVKICDSPERVRDTLAHELCHAAVRLINNINEGHGVFWKSWARKVNRTFSFMPVIARCHSYSIATKYTYQCVNCKYRIGRHSKSLDTDRKICGHCHGKFELYLTRELHSRSSDGQTPATPATPRTPNKFAMFVKECYSQVKQRQQGLRHGDIMKILSQEFAGKNKICD